MKIINAGIPGNNSEDILERLNEIIAFKPDVVLLMVGTNDVLNSAKAVSYDKYESNVATIVEHLSACGAIPVLMTILPCLDSYVIERHPPTFFEEERPSRKIQNANHILKRLAISRHLSLIDLYHQFGEVNEQKTCLLRNEANSEDRDGVHPTPDGYRIIAQMARRFLSENQLEFNTLLCLGDSITYGVKVEGAGTDHGTCYPGWLRKSFDCS